MARSNALSTRNSTELGSPAELVEAARSFAEAATASSTRRAYGHDWRAFEAWCVSNELRSLPAEPATVALFLAALAKNGKRVATVRRALAAIAKAHTTSGHPSPRADESVKLVMRGIARQLGVAPSQKAALLPEDLRKVSDALPKSLHGIRDLALVTFGFAGAFRRSELVALEVRDLTFTDAGVEALVRRSKTDQEGAGLRKAIPRGAHVETCPVRALQAWLAAAQLKSGPVFRGVNRHGAVGTNKLDGGSIARIVKRLVRLIGMSTENFAGHSLRAGMITAAVKAGKPESAIMRHTGHRSVEVFRRYVRDADIFAGNPVSGIGL